MFSHYLFESKLIKAVNPHLITTLPIFFQQFKGIHQYRNYLQNRKFSGEGFMQKKSANFMSFENRFFQTDNNINFSFFSIQICT